MKAMRVHEISEDISILRMEDIDLPSPAHGELRVRMKACSINFPDILMIQGKYQYKPDLPFSPGMEGAGVIDAIGSGVEGFSVGDKVVTGMRCGGMAEYANVAAAATRHLPDGIDFITAAAYPAAYLTAYVGLVIRAHLQPGETLLVHGASGGVGLAAVDVGKLLGATVIATSASDEKLAIVKSRGADHVINVNQGFREKVKELTHGEGANVIFDPVGGHVFDESARCIAFDGRLLVVGFTSGRIPTISVNMPLIKGYSILGLRAGEYGRKFPEAGRRNLETIDAWVAEGKIHPYVCATFPLAQAVDAMRVLQERRAIGKVVVTMDGY